MPIYTYHCIKCKRIFDVRHPMDWQPILHSDVTEGHNGLPNVCDGKLRKTIQPINFTVKNSTPKFFKGGK